MESRFERLKEVKQEVSGILENKSEPLVRELFQEYLDRELRLRKTKEIEDVKGKEVKSGSKNVKRKEDIEFFERIVEEPNFIEVHFLEEGAVRQKSVARIAIKSSNSGWGTGFLVGRSLLMTNNHVIEQIDDASRLKVQFNYQNDFNGNPLTIDEYNFDTNDTVAFWTNNLLDYTLIRLKRKSRFDVRNYYPVSGLSMGPPATHAVPSDDLAIRTDMPYGTANSPFWLYKFAGNDWGWIQLPDPSDIDYLDPSDDPNTWQHINIIQHPRGRRKEVALQRNLITNTYQYAIRYTTDTEPGSSGSPVFDNYWNLLAIHHAGGEQSNGGWIDNEGMRMDEIVDDIRSHFGGMGDSGTAILDELGI